MTAARTAEDRALADLGGCVADAAVETIQREMTAFARRARTFAGRLHPELSLVSYSLLRQLEEGAPSRATDLAERHALDKSTVSRQIATLERAGLIERRLDPRDHRVHVLHLTDAGRNVLAQAGESRRTAVRERLADWPEEDLVRFAGYLERYNAGPGPAPTDG
ncbi:MarR family winged helix-turn-helix transcriptional regulator [Streptomyces cadmiisoli]|uniref:MarR family winged helix-turn-helix transcriptional regulator n=1 Tax=Streptomyces cadmiisoli TaxID=2184053 RepID=UPI003660E7A3